MTQLQLEDICADDLHALGKEIDSYLNTHDAAERACSERSGDYEGLQDEALLKAHKVKERLRSLAIAFGVHRDFLDEYMDSCKQNGLQLTVATAPAEF